MEARRPLHYHRNTVIVPQLGSKSRRQMQAKPLDIQTGELKVPQNTDPKICSTLECPRCGSPQTEYRATCRRCMACFYCGLVGGSKYQCQMCGNCIPEEERQPPADRSIKIG